VTGRLRENHRASEVTRANDESVSRRLDEQLSMAAEATVLAARERARACQQDHIEHHKIV
jgi:hypothetical protein